MTIRVLIVDDQQMVREGLAVVLDAQDGIEVVGHAADGAAALEEVDRLGPDVVLMDIRMPVMDGLEATRRLCAQGRDGPRVIVLTTYDLDEYVYLALRAGASGFLLKDARAQSLSDAVHTVAAGDALLAPSVTRRLLDEFARMSPRVATSGLPAVGLTRRENEILTLVARGMSNGEIAAQLVISEQTVKSHVGHILDKLGLRDRTQAAIYAYEHKIVRPIR